MKIYNKYTTEFNSIKKKQEDEQNKALKQNSLNYRI